MAKRFDQKRILSLLASEPGREWTVRGVMRALALPGRDRGGLETLLGQMVASGQVRLIKNRRYAMNVPLAKVSGVLSLHRDGYGFVRPVNADERGKDVFIPARYLNTAMHEDQVIAEVVRVHPDGRREGRVLRVEKRARQQIVGVFQESGRHALVVPDDPRFGQPLKVVWGEHLEARDGDLVVAHIDTYGSRGQSPLARVIERLGDPSDPRVEIRAQVLRFDLRDHFPQEVLDEAERVARDVVPSDLEGRRDVRHLPFVTIDGEDARDFDDAVCGECCAGGGFRVWVAIADVAHYVEEGSALDHEAWSRGNSVYFPGACLPMLPETLSNGICSLKPDVDRLVLVAEIVFDSAGKRQEASIYPGVITSRARLTYRQVQDYFDGEGGLSEEIHGSLEALADMVRLLRGRRLERGSLDLDLPEARVELDEQGQPLTLVRSERWFSHQLIEELMLAANEAVADELTEKNVPMLYRVHEPPDSESLEPLRRVLRGIDHARALPDKVTPAVLKDIVSTYHATRHAELVSHVVLRCLQQARYDALNTGHFGLASECYCHFTSPIRRYPDLVVHRALKRLWRSEGGLQEEWLVKAAEQSSRTERRAMDAERDLVALKGCQVMQRHLGEVFSGKVSSLAPFGVFVELEEIFVEGMISLESFHDDGYSLDERRLCLVGGLSGREIHLGDELRVQVAAVRPERREIDFVPEGYREQPGRVLRPGKRTERRRGRRSR